MQGKFRPGLLRLLEKLETLPGIILGLIASTITAIISWDKFSDVLYKHGYPLKAPYKWSILIVLLGAIWIPYLISFIKGFKLSFWKPLFLAGRFIPYNLWLLFFGNIKQRNRLKDVHLVTKFLQQSALFAKLVGLKPGVTSKYFILFSHLQENGNNSSNSHIDHADLYRIRSFPLDEAECIFRLWYLAASSLHLNWTDIQAQCSCTWNDPTDKKNILDGPIAIIGSPKNNIYAEELMKVLEQVEGKQIFRQSRLYLKKDTQTGDCNLHGDQLGLLKPEATKNRKTGDQLKDYALLMKLPNLLTGNSPQEKTVLLLAGCKVAGQLALTDWFSDALNTGDLVSTYGSEPFQIVFEIHYKFVEKKDGLFPIILKTQELYREKISVQSQLASTAATAR